MSITGLHKQGIGAIYAPPANRQAAAPVFKTGIGYLGMYKPQNKK